MTGIYPCILRSWAEETNDQPHYCATRLHLHVRVRSLMFELDFGVGLESGEIDRQIDEIVDRLESTGEWRDGDCGFKVDSMVAVPNYPVAANDKGAPCTR